jgi:protein-disulfide isomerase
MLRIVRIAHLFPARRSRAGLIVSRASLFLSVAALTLAPAARAQFGAPSPGIQVRDSSALHPPPGSRVAIVEFMDMECPVCASTNPILLQAAAKYKIPLIRHDFLIPYHAWSPIAAVNARWFDAQSKALGEDYRNQVFANQQSLYNNPEILRQFTQKFADYHHITLPFSLDPKGELAAAVKADNDLGIRMGINATPTVFIVTSGSKGPPYVQVQRPDQNLYQAIDQAMADTAAPIKPVKTAPAKTPVKKASTKTATTGQAPAAKTASN